MSQNTILALQSFLITLQTINAGVGTVIKSPIWSLIIAASIGGLQFYIQNVGNKSIPPPK